MQVLHIMPETMRPSERVAGIYALWADYKDKAPDPRCKSVWVIKGDDESPLGPFSVRCHINGAHRSDNFDGEEMSEERETGIFVTALEPPEGLWGAPERLFLPAAYIKSVEHMGWIGEFAESELRPA